MLVKRKVLIFPRQFRVLSLPTLGTFTLHCLIFRLCVAVKRSKSFYARIRMCAYGMLAHTDASAGSFCYLYR